MGTEDDSHEGRIMLTFYAYSERCQHLCRILESLEAVIAVRCCPQDAAVNELRLKAQSIKMLLGTMEEKRQVMNTLERYLNK